MQAAVLDFGLSFAERSQRAGSASAAALQRTRAILGARMVPAESQAPGFGRAAAVESRGVWQWMAAAAAVFALSGAGFLYCKETVAQHVTEPATAVLAIGVAASGVGANPFAVPGAAAAEQHSTAAFTVKLEAHAVACALLETTAPCREWLAISHAGDRYCGRSPADGGRLGADGAHGSDLNRTLRALDARGRAPWQHVLAVTDNDNN